MNMSGGTISNNQSAREGGGVSLGWLNRNDGSAIYEYITFFNMTGGTFAGNLATSTGGGLNITAGRSAELSAGTFTNNTANGKEYQPGDSSVSWSVYSGGAIYLDSKQFDGNGNYAGKPGYAKIHRVLIANNTADLYGGGIATCSTSSGTVNASVEMDGTLIYNNTADSGGNEMYLQGNTTLVGNKMLGGGTYSWSKSGYYYDNSLTENSTDVKNGKPLATVIITGNHAGVDGGGIGCNGEIEIGGTPKTESISITKVWNDDGTVAHPDSITVQVYNGNTPYGDPITIYPTVDANGKEIWPTVYVDNLPEGGNYTVKEVNVPGFDSTVKANGSNFTITNTPRGFSVVKRWVGDAASNRPPSIQVQLFQDGTAYGEPVELNAGNGWKYMWMNLPDGFTYTAREEEVPDGYYITGDGELLDPDTWQITNTLSPLTSISVEKRWEGGDPLDSVTVYLLSNGVQIGEATLNAANNWFYKWDGLPVYGKLGTEVVYTVEEAAVRGYERSIREATSADATTSWVPVNGLASGKTYMLVSDQGALTVSGGVLAWTDASAAINGGAAEPSQLWTYNSSKLLNTNGKYLNLSSTSLLFGTYYYHAADSGSNISYSDGYLSASGGFATRYFGAIGSDGTAATSTGKSGATKFTLYEYSTNEGSWGADHYIVTNTKLPDSIEFRFAKYAVGSGPEPTLLAGAQLELYQVSAEGVTIPGTDQTGILLRSWTSESANSETGGYRIEDLYSGTYYLIETLTPSGHLGLSGPIIFEVLAEYGQVNVISSPYELTLETGQSVHLPIYNQVTYELPQTGGTGTALYTFGGLLLMIAALALLLYNKNRRGGAATYY
jgi:LPXTG-motif cell wall-anchored protein